MSMRPKTHGRAIATCVGMARLGYHCAHATQLSADRASGSPDRRRHQPQGKLVVEQGQLRHDGHRE